MEESAENLQLMRLLDEQYTRTPFYGVRRIGSASKARRDRQRPETSDLSCDPNVNVAPPLDFSNYQAQGF